MMKILILGAQGRLGQELTNILGNDYEVYPLSRFNVDISDFQALNKIIDQIKPQVIINAVAITNHHIKTSSDTIWRSNTVGAVNVAVICAEKQITLLHISCASVLAGNTEKHENVTLRAIDIINTSDLISDSKIEAENMINKIRLKQDLKVHIIRTGILFGEYAHSIVRQTSRFLKEKKSLSFNADNNFSLTSTKTVANLILGYLKQNHDLPLIYHCTYPEQLSYFALALKINSYLKLEVKIEPKYTKDNHELTNYTLTPSTLASVLANDTLDLALQSVLLV